MTPIAPARTALILIASLSLAACGEAAATRGDGGLWEGMAEHVAAIPVSDLPRPSAAERGLRPALEVEVMDVHDFWDARDGRPVPPPVARVAEAAVAGAAREAGDMAAEAMSGAKDALHGRVEAPARARPAVAKGGRTVQLGAFSTEEGARRAWSDIAARLDAAAGLAPRFEAAEVGGRWLVRLKAGPVTAEQAPALCRAAGVEADWCHAPSTAAA